MEIITFIQAHIQEITAHTMPFLALIGVVIDKYETKKRKESKLKFYV